MRIREKWEGRKHANHHGDFYVCRDADEGWFVLESKGIKSNSEKWHKLFNRQHLVAFLRKHRHLTPFADDDDVEAYLRERLPRFYDDFAEPLYSRTELAKERRARSERKRDRLAELQEWPPERIAHEMAERIAYVRTAIRVIETHFVSGGSKVGKRTQATPRADEFHVVSLDLFLRTGAHEFLFVDPKKLAPSTKDADHLRQNYVVDILLEGAGPKPAPSPWTTDLQAVFDGLSDPVDEADMQVDARSDEERAAEVAAVGEDPL